MTPFRFEREFQTTPETYWRVFFDKECMAEQYRLMGVRSYDFTVWREDDDTLERTVHVVPEPNLPPVLRQVFGGRMAYDETTTWYKHENRAETRVVPATMASKTSITGRHTVRALADDRILRVFQGEIEIRIPLLGGRMERSVVAQMQVSYARTSEITRAWLERANSERSTDDDG